MSVWRAVLFGVLSLRLVWCCLLLCVVFVFVGGFEFVCAAEGWLLLCFEVLFVGGVDLRFGFVRVDVCCGLRVLLGGYSLGVCWLLSCLLGLWAWFAGCSVGCVLIVLVPWFYFNCCCLFSGLYVYSSWVFSMVLFVFKWLVVYVLLCLLGCLVFDCWWVSILLVDVAGFCGFVI